MTGRQKRTLDALAVVTIMVGLLLVVAGCVIVLGSAMGWWPLG